MGDMADYELSAVLDNEEAWTEYSIGNISIEEAIEMGILNEYGGEEPPYNIKVSTSVVVCKYCKKEMVWMKPKDKWRLHEKNGKLHICPVNPLKEKGK